MKLYYATGTCSFAPHVALREAGLVFELVRFDMKTQTLEDGRAIREVNPKGYVPVLEIDTGERITEVSVILQWIADRVPSSGLLPDVGGLARYRALEWLSFLGMEVHKIFWPLFHQGAEVENEKARARLTDRFRWLEEQLGEQQFFFQNRFSVIDAYLVTVLNWTRAAGIDLNALPKLKEYRSRLRERPSVREALKAEGLLR